MTTLRRAAGILLLGALLAGCAGTTIAGTPGPVDGAGPIDTDPPYVSTCETTLDPLTRGGGVPTPTGAPMITITQGTNAWIASERTQPFAVAVYPDGTAIRSEDLGTSGDPPATLTIGRIEPCALAADSAEIVALATADVGDPLVTDQGTTTVTLHQPAGDVVVAAYALGIGDDNVSAPQKAARQRLTAVIEHLESAMTDTGPWTPDRLRLTSYGAPADPTGALDWPLDRGIERTLGNDDPQCAILAGADAGAVLDTLGARSASSSWTDGDSTLVLALGPLVPGQQGCPS
ncbi:hypothetical protein ACVBEQ_08860 [Nakamurella sp. GG22]